MYKPDEITVIDNFLPEHKYKQIRGHFVNKNYFWQIGPSLYEREDVEILIDPKLDCQGVSMLYYHKGKNDLSRLKPIVPILSKLKVTEKHLIRIKANCNFCKESVVKSGWHIDVDPDIAGKGMTAIYYCNTCNGKTLFKTGEEIDSVENRLLIFPNYMAHTPQYQTDEPIRVVINLNWVLDINDKP